MPTVQMRFTGPTTNVIARLGRPTMRDTILLLLTATFCVLLLRVFGVA
ncbi:hypothetical protein AB5I41_15540 [Sphingomonas sp. MMS24-JH45]